MKNVFLIILVLFAFSSFGQSKFPTGIRVGKNNSSTVSSIDSIATSGTKIKFYRGTTMLAPFNADTISGSAVFLQIKDSLGYGIGNYMTRQNVLNDANKDNTVKLINLNGFGMKGTPIVHPVYYGTNTMTDGSLKLVMHYFDKVDSITGFKFTLGTAGAYTGDNENRIGLYSISGTTYTLIASSANDAALWTATAATVATKAFSSSVIIQPGFYYLALLYNCSGTATTSPAINIEDNVGPIMNLLGTNYVAGQKSAVTTLPASITKAELTGSISCSALIPY